MDSTVIQEIANQLGMAVDQAGQFVTEQLPAFAAMKMLNCCSFLILVGSLFVAAIVFTIVCYFVSEHQYKNEIAKYEKENEEYEKMKAKALAKKAAGDYCGYIDFLWDKPYEPLMCNIFARDAMCGGLIASGVLFVALLLVSALVVPQIIGWSNYPEAMLIDMALKAVG